jgi:membrane glycosyltransferase
MDFIEHSIAWCKGEIFEARLILLFGILMVVVAFLFLKTGSTPAATAMFYPLLVVGVLFTAGGATMQYTNPKRIVEFQKAYKEDPKAFIQSEKERTDNFINWYPKTMWIATVVGLAGMALFMFWPVPIGRAIGISLIILMLATFVIDHFSEERAEIYHKHIVEALE